MKPLILVGGGGHCKSVIDVVEQQGEYTIVGILDTAEKVGQQICGYPVLGTDSQSVQYIDEGYHFLVTVGQIGAPTLRKKLFQDLLDSGAHFATVISPNSVVSSRAKIGEGTVIMPGAIVGSEAIIGHNCIINSNALIEHESQIGANSHVSTGVCINGNTIIGKGSFIGSGATVVQGIKVAESAFVKAASLIKSDLSQAQPRVAFLTTLFPLSKRYIDDFMLSLVNQSYQSFDLLIMNDGYGNLSQLQEQYPELSFVEIKSAGSIAKNREKLINSAVDLGYEIAIFGDIDDYFSSRRIELSLEKLKHFDIVVNDYTSFNDEQVICRKYISNRLSNNSEISLDFILDKNIFGLSNTAIKTGVIRGHKIHFESDLVAVDWYFYSFLLSKGIKSVFTNEFETFYRQHNSNTIGSGPVSDARISEIIDVKQSHYQAMAKINSIYKQFLVDAYEHRCSHTTYPLWWEI